LKYSIGIDLGTSSVKVIVIDENGKVVLSKSKNYQINRPQKDFVEQNPEEWWSKTKEALKQAFKELKDDRQKVNISCIGISGQMHGLTTFDKNNNLIGPAIIWADNRSKEEVKFIKDKLNDNELKLLANPIVTSFTASKLLWLKNNRKNDWDKLNKILLPKDYIAYKLTGKFITDKSDASGTLLFDIEKGVWSETVLSKLEIPIDIMPEVVDPGAIIGKVSDGVKEILQIDNDVDVILAGGDAPVSAWASGATSSGEACISLGTAGQIILPINNFHFQKEYKLHSMHYVKPGYWYIMGAILSAGYNFKWWFENIIGLKQNLNKIFTDVQSELAKIPAGSDGIVYLPYLNGERSPINDPDASGMIFGLRGYHTNYHIIKSIMEGVIFALRSNIELIEDMGLEIKKVHLTGGGANSSIWSQVCADILKKNVYISNNKYGTGYGAALLSAKAAKTITNPEKIIKDRIVTSKIYKPDKNNINIYDNIYNIYEKLYTNNKGLMSRLNNLSKV